MGCSFRRTGLTLKCSTIIYWRYTATYCHDIWSTNNIISAEGGGHNAPTTKSVDQDKRALSLPIQESGWNKLGECNLTIPPLGLWDHTQYSNLLLWDDEGEPDGFSEK